MHVIPSDIGDVYYTHTVTKRSMPEREMSINCPAQALVIRTMLYYIPKQVRMWLQGSFLTSEVRAVSTKLGTRQGIGAWFPTGSEQPPCHLGI